MSSVMSPRNFGADRHQNDVHGEFIDMQGDRYYAIRNVHEMAPFFVSVVSSDDHWLFVSSTGGITAGRVSPETALFPYETVDRLHLSINDTGPKTIVRVGSAGEQQTWEPFNTHHLHRYAIRRNIYKTTLGNKLCFEEVNDDLGLVFRYTWSMSEEFGFVRDSELHNVGDGTAQVDVPMACRTCCRRERRGLRRLTPATSSMRTSGRNSTKKRG